MPPAAVASRLEKQSLLHATVRYTFHICVAGEAAAEATRGQLNALLPSASEASAQLGLIAEAVPLVSIIDGGPHCLLKDDGYHALQLLPPAPHTPTTAAKTEEAAAAKAAKEKAAAKAAEEKARAEKAKAVAEFKTEKAKAVADFKAVAAGKTHQEPVEPLLSRPSFRLTLLRKLATMKKSLIDITDDYSFQANQAKMPTTTTTAPPQLNGCLAPPVPFPPPVSLKEDPTGKELADWMMKAGEVWLDLGQFDSATKCFKAVEQKSG